MSSEPSLVDELWESLVTAVLALTDAPHGSRALVPRLAEYVTASEQLWAFIDAWRSQAR